MPSLILVRHGDTDYVGKRLAGALPGVHLNQHGKQQVEILAGKLAAIPITKIYSSPLERTVETAEIIAHVKDLPVNILPALMEIDVGDWQGKSIPSLRRLKLWRHTHDEPARFSFPNGESFSEKQRVICNALTSLIQRAGKHDILVCVSHGDPIKLSLAYFLGLDLNNFQRLTVDPASASVISFHGNTISVGPINLIDKIVLGHTNQ